MGKNLGTVHLDLDHKKYWNKISDFCFSKWAFLFLISGLFFFLVDWFIDVTLLLAYGREKQWQEFGLTVFILLASGTVTSLLYRVNQQWIDDKHDFLANNAKYKDFWKRVRWVSQILLLTPVFRVIFCWKDLKSKKKLIRQHARVERLPVSKEEVEAVVSVSERDISNHSFNMVESFLESIPQGIIQIYIACILVENLQLNTLTEWIRFVSIVSPVVTAAISSTLYTGAYFKHVQTLHFEDYFCFGRKIPFVTFGFASYATLFLANIFVIGARFCGIAFLFINYGAVGLAFIPVLYTVQFLWLQMYPSGRMSYDNPPRGITSTCSNMVDRWINVFTFSMVHPNIKNFLVYQCIFVLLFEAFIGFLTPMPSADAKLLFQNLTIDISELNETKFNAVGSALAVTSNNVSSLTLSDITYAQFFTSQTYILYLWFASLLFSGLYLYALRREKSLIPRHFPLTKVYRFWEDLLKNAKSGLDARMRRHICLCVLADDVDLYKVQDHFTFICGFGREKCLQKLDRLWIKYCSKLHPAITSNRQELISKWTEVKNRMAMNGSLDMFRDWMDQALNGEYDFTVDDESEEFDVSKLLMRQEEDIQMFFTMCSSFEDYMAAMNSFRFGKISNILNLDLHPFPCYTSFAIFSSAWSGILALALGAAHFWGMNSESGSPSPPRP